MYWVCYAWHELRVVDNDDTSLKTPDRIEQSILIGVRPETRLNSRFAFQCAQRGPARADPRQRYGAFVERRIQQ
ncbi:hypothetical protein Airi01_086100 [Actinoallomurus iriomotensis]|uniref:Uncharacterized protein n=1 Tax=Actinoallomurus iriomotensis TaxID=478107 RepID=A0A9W6RRB2_9ACTN|nr:hypothetical protein Airi01_086100 [Actinoallomurus iriomotensis]